MMMIKTALTKILILLIVVASVFSSSAIATTNNTTSLTNSTAITPSNKILNFIHSLTVTFMELGWGLFALSWVIGWVLRGSPIHYDFVKRTGQKLIDDAILAGFFLGIGSTVFYLIQWIASQLNGHLILVLHI